MARMKRCYTCGYEERILSRVVYCVNCEETMVHRYCMDPPRHGDEEFDWVCEICCPRVCTQSKSRRTSEYLSSKLASEAVKRNSRRRLKKLGHKSHDHREDSKKPLGSLEEFAAELESLHSASNDFGEMQCDLQAQESLPGTNRTTKKEGSADLEQVSHTCDTSQCSSQTSNGTHEGRGQSLKKDQDPMKCPPLQEPKTDLRCNSSCSPQSENLSSCLPSVSYLHKPSSSLVRNDVNEGSAAHHPTLGVGRHQLIPRVGDGSHGLIASFRPVSDVSWRGTCRVTDKTHRKSVELEAHLSNSANFKVSDAARTLPLPLDLELVDKLSEWPNRFSKEPPCGDDIGLYFFPSQSSDRKAYDDLLGKMILDDLSLRFTRSDLRLLVFSSLELPKGAQRFEGKLYLWGVFCAPLSLPSGEKVGIHRPLVPGHSKGSSCLEEDLASNKKGRGSSNAIQPTQRNAHSNDQRDSGHPSSSLLRPVSEMETRHETTLPVRNSPQPTWKSLKPASVSNQADPKKHEHAANGKRDALQDPNVHSNPNTQIEGGKASACIKKRKRGKAEFPDQDRKPDAPGNPAINCKHMFNKSEKGNFNKQQYNQNFRFSPGAKQKQKNKQKKYKKQCPPYKRSPLDKAPEPGSQTQRSLDWHHEDRTTSSGAEHSLAMNGSFSPHQTPQSDPHPCQVPSFSRHEMPVNGNWNEHSHPQPCSGFSGGQHTMQAAGQSHPQPCPSFPGGQRAVPVTGHSHPMQYGGFPGGQPPSYPGGQHALPVAEQPHPQQRAAFSGGQHAIPPPGFPGGQRAVPVAEQSHPQHYASFPGGQRAMPVAGHSHPQQYAGFSGGQHTMPVAGHSQFQPYAGLPGGQHGMPVTGGWHPQPYAGYPSGQQAMWRPHANVPGGQQAMPVVGTNGQCP